MIRALQERAARADAHQADHLYLQVERDNVPALSLYGQTGFTEVCRYHYRARA